MTNKELKQLFVENVVPIITLEDVPFGVLVDQISGKVYKGTDGKLYIVANEGAIKCK